MVNSARLAALLAVFSASLQACTGIVAGERPDRDKEGFLPVGGASGPSGSNGTPGPTTPTQRAVPNFKVPAQFPVLLPFKVRISRLSAVVGLPYSDSAFELLRANATQLGDYDYANGLEPDNTWTAFKMSLWVQSLKPVCASSAMLTRYPSLPESSSELLEAAYGRSITERDTADMTAALGSLPLSAESRTQTTCLAVLSSLEFLAQ
jgi:hypothetical protein